MNARKIALFVTLLVFMGATASLCAYIQKSRRLGPAGLKLVDAPAYDSEGKVFANQLVALPDKVLNYVSSTNMPITTLELQTLPSDTTFGRRVYYAPDEFGILLNVVMMGVDSRSIHRPEHCLPGQGWVIEKSESVNVPVQEPFSYELPVKKITAIRETTGVGGKKQSLKALYVYWFVAQDDLTAEHFDRMWKMGKNLVSKGVLQRWSYVAAMTHCLPGQEDATFNRMKEFISASVPQFQIPTGKPMTKETARLTASE